MPPRNVPEAKAWHLDGRVPALRPEHHRGNPVHSPTMGGGRGGSRGVLPHHVPVLFVCKSNGSWNGCGRTTPTQFISPSLQALLTSVSLSAIATNGVVPGELSVINGAWGDGICGEAIVVEVPM